MTYVLVEGRASTDAQLHTNTYGRRTAFVSIAVTDRTRHEDGSWGDVKISYYEVVVWDDPGRHFAASVKRGDTVFVAGELSIENQASLDGRSTTRRRIIADHAGMSTRYATVSARLPTNSGQLHP